MFVAAGVESPISGFKSDQWTSSSTPPALIQLNTSVTDQHCLWLVQDGWELVAHAPPLQQMFGEETTLRGIVGE